MILCNLPVLLAERRMKVADLIRMTGISKSTMHKIYNEQTSRIDFDMKMLIYFEKLFFLNDYIFAVNAISDN